MNDLSICIIRQKIIFIDPIIFCFFFHFFEIYDSLVRVIGSDIYLDYHRFHKHYIHYHKLSMLLSYFFLHFFCLGINDWEFATRKIYIYLKPIICRYRQFYTIIRTIIRFRAGTNIE